VHFEAHNQYQAKSILCNGFSFVNPAFTKSQHHILDSGLQCVGFLLWDKKKDYCTRLLGVYLVQESTVVLFHSHLGTGKFACLREKFCHSIAYGWRLFWIRSGFLDSSNEAIFLWVEIQLLQTSIESMSIRLLRSSASSEAERELLLQQVLDIWSSNQNCDWLHSICKHSCQSLACCLNEYSSIPVNCSSSLG